MNRTYNIIATLACLVTTSLHAEKLHSYDIEIERARKTLQNVRLKLEASPNLFDTAKSFTKKQSKENAKEAAKHWRSLKECRSAIREYQSFIDLSQEIGEEDAKEANLSLARCYKASENFSKAFRFYRLYISSYITSEKKDEETLVKSLKDIIDISSQSTILSRSQVRKMISSLSVLADNKENSFKVKLWSAKLAERFGYSQTAEKWYRSIYENDDIKENSTKILALYYASLMKFSKGTTPEARALLKKAIELAKEKETDSSIYLTIARMYVHEKSHQMALEYYQKIKPESEDYADALYELTFIALKQGEIKTALAAVNTFQKKFPKKQEAVTLNNISAYLHLHTGDLKLTDEKLREIDKKYDSLSQWIRTHFAYLDSVPQVAVDKLIAKTSGFVNTTSAVEMANDLYQKISRNQREIYEGRNDLRRLIFVLGRSNLETLQPHWVQKTKQIKMQALEVLGAAHRLVASELNFLSEFMDEHDRKKIEVRMKKRMELFSEKSMNRFRKGQWVQWYNYESATESLNQKIAELMYGKARLAANRHLIKKNKKKLAFLKTINSQLRSRMIDLESYALRGREIARKAQINIKLDLAELPAFKKFYLGYANSIYEEEKTMEKYRAMDTRFAQNELKDKFKVAWSEWEYLAQEMFKHIADFEKRAKSQLSNQTRGIDDLLVRYERLSKKLRGQRNSIEQILAKNIKNIVRQYELNISERRSKVKKWSGDLKWLGFEDAKNTQQDIQKKYLLEKEILNEAL